MISRLRSERPAGAGPDARWTAPRLSSLGALLLAGLSAAACVATPEDEGTARSPIVNGEISADHEAVGVLALRRSRCEQVPDTPLCTATLVAERVAITAGHCVTDYRERMLSVHFGAGLGEPDGRAYAIDRHVVHPLYDEVSSDYDIALLRLAEAPPIAPIPLNEAALDDSWLGRSITLVGYGESGDGDSDGLKRAGLAEIEQVQANTFRYGAAPAMTCRGDSGGPALLIEDGTARLLGVTSAGDAACISHGIDVRVDAVLQDFLLPAMAALAEPATAPSLDGPALCEQVCTSDEACPGQLLCQPDERGVGRCVHPQLEPGRFEQTCRSDDQCGSGHCAPFQDSCACYTPCAGPSAPDPSGHDPKAKALHGEAPPSAAPSCAAAHGAKGGGSNAACGWLLLLGLCGLLRRDRPR